MPFPTLARVEDVLTSAGTDTAYADFAAEGAPGLNASALSIRPLTDAGLAPAQTLPLPSVSHLLSPGDWVGVTAQGTVTPATDMAPGPFLSLFTPSQRLFALASNDDSLLALARIGDAHAGQLQSLIDRGALSASGKTPWSGPRPHWTAAPCPHWVWARTREDADATAGGPALSQTKIEEDLPEDYLRLGSVAFLQASGPQDLRVDRTPQLDILPVLRNTVSLKRLSGASRQVITFTYIFPDETAISQELVPLMRQARRTPFVPIVHKELLHEHGITAVAVQAVSVSTLPEFPGALQAQVTCYPFPWDRFGLDADIMDASVCYPLLELWLASRSPLDSRGRGTALASQSAQDAPPLAPTWDGILSLSTPAREWLDLVRDNQTATESATIDEYLTTGTNGTIVDLGQIGAQALSADPAVSAAALAELPGADDPDVNQKGVVRLDQVSTGGSAVPPGPYVAFRVTPALAPYAFAQTRDGGPDYVLQGTDGPPAISSAGDLRLPGSGAGSTASIADVTGRTLSDQERAQISGNASIAQAGGYLALWRVGGRAVLPGTGGRPDVLTADALAAAAAAQQLDPNRPVYTDPLVLTGFTVESVRGGIVTTLAEISPSDADMPEYHHTGSGDAVVEFSGVCDLLTLQRLQEFMDEVSSLSVDYRGQWDGTPYGGYCRLDNEIASLLGISAAIPTGLTVETLDAQPEGRRVTLGFVCFDPTQRRYEAPRDFSGDTGELTTGDDFVARAASYAHVEEILRRIDLYPDIQPPTWAELCVWLDDLKQGRVWDEAANAPGPDYPWLTSWPYTPAYLTKWAGAFVSQGAPVPEGTEPPPGYADPDFWVCGRGDPGNRTGPELFSGLLDTMYGQKGADPHAAVFTGTDGVEMAVQCGTAGVQLAGSDRTLAALRAHADSANGTTTGGAAVPPVLGVPASSLDTTTTRAVTGSGAAEPQTGLGLSGASGPANDPATFAAKTAVPVKAGLWKPAHVAALSAAATRLGIPLVVAANIALAESGVGISTSRTGARGLIQVEPDTFTEYHRKAVAQGLLPAGLGNQDDITQNATVGLLFLKAQYESGAGYLDSLGGYSDAERKFYAWQFAAAAYNVGAGAVGRLFKQDPRAFSSALAARYGHAKSAYNRVDRYTRNALDGLSVASFSASGSGAGSPPPATYLKTPSGQALLTAENRATLVGDAGSIATALSPPPPPQGYEEINNRVWDDARAAYDPLHGEDLFWSARRSENNGRLLRAYPTSLILLVNGGRWLRFYHFVDTFYGLHSALDVSVFSSRKTPADTCTVAFADPYNLLSAAAADVDLSKADSTQLTYGIGAVLRGAEASFGPNDDIAQRRAQELKAVLVRPGNRLHVRLGYGSDATELPTVFNGVISSVEHDDDALLVTGLGDGVELTSQLSPAKGDGAFYQAIGTAGAGQEVRDIILDILAAGSDSALTRLTRGYFGGANPYGIEHFGDVRFSSLGNPDDPQNVTKATVALGVAGFIAAATKLGVATDTSEIGINCYSGWGDQPVNITVAAEDGPLGLFFTAPDWPIEVEDALRRWFRPGGPEYLDGMGANRLFRSLNGEKLVGIRLEDATPWDVFETLRRTCLDYVCSVEPFGLRSTLFFGKDWWPYHYAYNAALLGLDPAARPEDLGLSSDGLVNPDVESFFRRRPLLQAHFAHSGLNLIASRLEPTQEGWARSVQAVGSYAGPVDAQQTETSLVQFIDSDIMPEFQSMKLVQSGLYSSALQRGTDAFSDTNPGEVVLQTAALNNYAVGALHDEVREMYQGNVYLLGNGFLRPRHLVHLVDVMRQISGPVEVKEVTHAFSPQNGFVTTFTPDCVAYAQDTPKFALVSQVCSVGGRRLTALGVLKAAGLYRRSGRLEADVRRSLARLGRIDDAVNRTGGAALRYAEYGLRRVSRGLWDRAVAQSPAGRVLARAGAAAAKLRKGKLVLNGHAIDSLFETLLVSEAGPVAGGPAAGLRLIHDRIAKHAIQGAHLDDLIGRVTDAYSRGLAKDRFLGLSTEECDRVAAVVARRLKRYRGLRVLKAGEAAGDHDSESLLVYLSRLGLHPAGRTRLDSYLRARERLRFLNTRISRTPAGRRLTGAALKYTPIADKTLDAAIRAALKAETRNAGFKRALGVLDAAGRDAQAELDRLRADPTPDEAAIKAAEADVKRINGLKAVAARARKGATLARKVTPDIRLGALGKLGDLTVKGALKVADIGVQICIGMAVTYFNRQIACRQALKILPLQSCGKEMTAGINGHLGAVVGDHLGVTDSLIATLFDSTASPVVGTIFNLALGLHASYADDPDAYRAYCQDYGLPHPDTDKAADVAARVRADLTRLAGLNSIGLLESGPDLGADIGSAVGFSGAGDSYLKHTSSTVGQKYYKIVQRLAAAVGDRDRTLTPNQCAHVIKETMIAAGLSSSWPGGYDAWKYVSKLHEYPWDQTWKRVALNADISSAQVPNGAIVVWDRGAGMSASSGHIGIVYDAPDGQRYMLGDYDGYASYDVTRLRGAARIVTAAYLPY